MQKQKMPKPTIWHLCSNRWNSALAEYALSCAKSLAMAGYPTVFSPLRGAIAEFRSKQYGLDTIPFGNFGMSSLFFFRKNLQAIAPQFIFVYGGQETFLSKFVDIKKTKVVRIKGLDQDQNPSSFSSYFGYRHVSAIVIPGEKLRSHTHPRYKGLVEKITLGCDTTMFQRVLPPVRDWKKERPEITLLGRLDPIKGHGRFFKIFSLLLREWREEKIAKPFLNVVGLPANLSELELVKMATSEGLQVGSDVVFSLKRISHLAKHLSASTLGVIPSNGSEVICRVAEEFLLCGTPIVVSGVGSLEEVLYSGAGASYKGLGDEEAARLTSEWIKRSVNESENEKSQRVLTAKAQFSYETMAKNFEEKVLRASHV